METGPEPWLQASQVVEMKINVVREIFCSITIVGVRRYQLLISLVSCAETFYQSKLISLSSISTKQKSYIYLDHGAVPFPVWRILTGAN